MRDVQALARHSSLQMTQRYVEVSEDAKGEFFMTIRIGSRKIEFEKGKPAIKVGPKDQIEPLISNLIVATQDGELDKFLAKPQTSSK